ncbi:hypothetical protein C0Q70_10514 [Pomacea canaliculata]|uniref:Citramalyl-CoA lyase, mitochondrial n=2 Tax=Pomacea canaliculata TaxID=400727 RepID=A0A2T7P3F3_POMCA|nr:hypothetical protein C0Q70_10514 [Pomacea canaliculata]
MGYEVLGVPSSKIVSRSISRNVVSEGSRKYVPRRTLMYVPGHDLKKLRKIPILGVDCAVLECEDGVALNKKSEARENIRMVLDELKEVKGVDIAVRVNSVGSQLLEEDLRVILTAENRPSTVLLPKTDTVKDIVQFTDCLRSILKDSALPSYCPRLITYVESAEGLINMKDILRRAETFSHEGIYHLDGVVFGADDFYADIGAVKTLDAAELTYVRQKIVTVAKAFRIQAIDMVFTDYKDSVGLQLQSEQGARNGYTGKQIIHPNQIPIVCKAFTPSAERVEWATQLIAAFEKHQESGEGAFTFQGHMVDMPLLLQAKNVIQTIKNVHKA